ARCPSKYSSKNKFPEFRCVASRSPRSDRVVPSWTHGVSFEVECVHLGIGDLLSDRVIAELEDGVHCQAARSRGTTDEGEQRIPGSQRHPGPVATDLAE